MTPIHPGRILKRELTVRKLSGNRLVLRLTARDRDKLLCSLDDPPAPTKALRRALAR